MVSKIHACAPADHLHADLICVPDELISLPLFPFAVISLKDVGLEEVEDLLEIALQKSLLGLFQQR